MHLLPRVTSPWPRRLALALALVLLPAAPAHADAAADQLMQQARDRPDGKDWMSEVDLVLKEPGGQERTRRMWFLKKQQGRDESYVMYFLTPANLRGVALLSLTRDEQQSREDDLWMHLPASRQTRRIAANDKRGAFMGSQFSYYDIEKLRVRDFTQTIVGTETVEGRETTRVERLPASPEVVAKSGYSKVIAWVDRATMVVVKQHLFDESGVLKKVEVIRQIKKIDGYWTPTEVEMTDPAEGKVSRMLFITTRYDVGLPDTLFQSTQLANGGLYERLPALR